MSQPIEGETEITLLLPVHNEAEAIEGVISELYEEIVKKIPLKIVIVEDGSTDGTKERLVKLSEKIPMTLILKDERRGYSKAVTEGIKKIDTKFVFFTDSDGQHAAKDFWTLYELREKYDILSGWRVKRADPIHRKMMSRVFQWTARVFFKLPRFHDITAPYKLMRSEVAQRIADEFKYMRESFWTEFTIRGQEMGFKIAEVPVHHKNRQGNSSTRVYKPVKIPRIALSQFNGLLKLWWELKRPLPKFSSEPKSFWQDHSRTDRSV
jgi:glycosyltransferase involved in cell wall biosynthesis